MKLYYQEELEKLDNFDRKRVERHMQVILVCISWLKEQNIQYTTTELLKMVELTDKERWIEEK